jgi:CBS domain-containing protein
MTVHSFPNLPIRNPARELGVSDIPVPPSFAMRDMEKANARFITALALDECEHMMPPEVARSARLDRERHSTFVRHTDFDGIPVVNADDLNKFVHYTTGHPMAWVLAWQLHSFAGSLTGMEIDREAAIHAFADHVRTAAKAIEVGFNREL